MLKLYSDPQKDYKLNMALFRLSHVEDFNTVHEWLLDNEARLDKKVRTTDGTPCHRIQGALQTLTDLFKFQAKARDTADDIRGSLKKEDVSHD